MEHGMEAAGSVAALAELDRVGRVVRSRSRWYGWFLLVLGAGTIGYYVAADAAAPLTGMARVVLSVGWAAFVVLLAWWARQQPVMMRGMRRLRIALMTVYFGLVGTTVLLNDAMSHEPPAGWALGIVPAVPCLVGAWVVLRR